MPRRRNARRPPKICCNIEIFYEGRTTVDIWLVYSIPHYTHASFPYVPTHCWTNERSTKSSCHSHKVMRALRPLRQFSFFLSNFQIFFLFKPKEEEGRCDFLTIARLKHKQIKRSTCVYPRETSLYMCASVAISVKVLIKAWCTNLSIIYFKLTRNTNL